MAIITVQLTSESFHHLTRILDAVIDDTQPNYINPRFQPLVDVLHYMVAGVNTDPTLTDRTGGTLGTPRVGLMRPTVDQEALKGQLDMMQDDCVTSIRDTNNQLNYELVLKV